MPEMKDSGIEWIGEIPSHWKVMANKYVMKKIKHIQPIYQGEDILSLTVNGVIVRDLDAGGKMPASFDGYQKLYSGNLLLQNDEIKREVLGLFVADTYQSLREIIA